MILVWGDFFGDFENNKLDGVFVFVGFYSQEEEVRDVCFLGVGKLEMEACGYWVYFFYFNGQVVLLRVSLFEGLGGYDFVIGFLNCERFLNGERSFECKRAGEQY